MFSTLFKKIVGSKNDRELSRISAYVEKINQLEAEISRLSDEQLKAKTGFFRERIEKGESLEELIPESFAVVRETAKRVLNMRHFDVQLIGGVVLHEGKIAEMATGEGKTLVATLPAYLNALSGKGVHVVTVNDYLARRDCEWMGGIYQFLGLSIGVIQHDIDEKTRQQAYASDITYGTNNEFGFDYLRDNMKFSLSAYVQRELNYAIIDEVDSILIDEARTPLIISGPSEESTEKYYHIDKIIPRLKKEDDYQIEEKTKTVTLTENGVLKAEKLLGVENLYDPENIEILHHVNQALKAHTLFKKDVDYMVKEGEVLIVDEFTGRLMPGRRWSDGLHQAVEAKEGVKIESENQTLASITFQNYFRIYKKIAGMTGTAETEAAEFGQIYNLEVLVIPPNRPLIRSNYPDTIYRTEREKFNALIQEIETLNKEGRPVLVGTISIEKSELLSSKLKRRGIKHNVLNAKYHEKEANIIADAGQKGMVTIATNMAGRGTDIVLGEGVAKMGGLHIIGTERHESRRIDNQLRGRSGRQGDPGSSRFYLSLEDDLLRIFGSEKLSTIMARLGMEEGQPIEHNLVSKAIENAQAKVEAHNFEIRKHLLEYDDVMNKQREVIYALRREILEGTNVTEKIQEMNESILEEMIPRYINEESPLEDWDLAGLRDALSNQFCLEVSLKDGEKLILDKTDSPGGKGGQEEIEIESPDLIKERLLAVINKNYLEKEERFGKDIAHQLEKSIMLQTIDNLWKDHLLGMDHLKEGIGLRGYGQKDPLNEYKREGFEMFSQMIQRVNWGVTNYLCRMQFVEKKEREREKIEARQRFFEHRGELSRGNSGKQGITTLRRSGKKIGRNDPCTCGSGKKYKKCCGR